MGDDAARLASELSLAEAVAACTPFDFWHSKRITRLGVPGVKVTDGPVGARGDGQIGSGTPALVLPCPTAMAATWDPELLRAGGAALAEEVRDRHAHGLLAPTVNLHRTPLAGRNFECYSEDPYLTARMAVGFITGVQSGGVAACVKHFVANDQEHERHTISAEVPERALRELYLLPFEAAVTEAGTWMLMSAYNRLGGTHCSEHGWLLTDLLRDEWGFDGVVVSDWFGTHTTAAAALAGLDWEMPGPSLHFGQRLLDSVTSGEVPEDVVRTKAARMLSLLARTGGLDGLVEGEPPVEPSETSQVRDGARAVARQLSAASIVMLANRPGSSGRPVLPLDPAPATLAVIGPNADEAWIQGGGSAQLNPHHVVTPLDGLRQRFAATGTEVVHEPGCLSVRSMPLLNSRLLVPLAADTTGLTVGIDEVAAGPDDRFYLVAEYWDNEHFAGEPLARVPLRAATGMFTGVLPPNAPATFWCRWSGVVEVPAAATVRFGISSAGPSRLLVDGQLVCDAWDHREPGEAFFGLGCVEVTGDVPPPAGPPPVPGTVRRLEVALEFTNAGNSFVTASRIGAAVLPPADGLARAVAAASAAEVAVVVVGLDHDTETEGRDRTTLALPAEQDELVAAVAAANPNTVVVVNAGAPVLMPWRNDVASVVQLWYPGQEGGHALADVLSGDVNPSGRLPTTFPASLDQVGAHTFGAAGYPGVDGAVRYDEGLLVGHRWLDAHDLEPEWCFGHGLSYTTFEWGAVALESLAPLVAGPLDRVGGTGREAVLTCSVELANTGDRDGHEVVQVYVAPPPGPFERAPRELRGFARVHVPAGQRVTATITLDRRAFAVWDPDAATWVVPPGTYTLVAAASSRDLRSSAGVDVG
jgi:beta-glucosidase